MRSATTVAAVGLLAIGVATVAGAEEPSTANRIPAFAGKTSGGESFSLGSGGEGLRLRRGERESPVKAALLHFFQPDCNACFDEMKALQEVHDGLAEKEVLVASVAHRGDEVAVRALVERLGLTYPVVMGQGSELARRHSRGDATVLADAAGVVRYSQVGYRAGDAKGWNENIRRLLAGEDVRADVNPRAVLAVGDAFPNVRLPALEGGEGISLAVEEGRLTFRDASGNATHPRAAVGFFSRY